MFTREQEGSAGRMQLGEGVFLRGFMAEASDASSFRAAVETAIAQGRSLGRTRGGKIVLKPVLRTMPQDGLAIPLPGSIVIDHWECKLETICLEWTGETLSLALAAAHVQREGGRTTVTPGGEMGSPIENLCWAGELAGGGCALLSIGRAVSTGGLLLDLQKGGSGIPIAVTACPEEPEEIRLTLYEAD